MTPGGYDDLDPGGLEEIGTEECWRLLASQAVGRVAVVVGHYPLIFPVNYAVDERHVIFRTAVGTKLWAVSRSNVAFQVDQFDLVHRAGWSVMVRGAAHEVDEQSHPGLKDRAAAAGAIPWAPGEREHVVSVIVDDISGRRIRPPETSPAGDPRGYV